MSTFVWSALLPPVKHRATARASAQVAQFAGTGSLLSIVNCMTVNTDGAGRPMGSGASPG